MPDINADFTARVVIRPGDIEWQPSPAKGVERQMLDRVGDEVAVATSIVRYAANSHFPEHHHEHGEEFLVLTGVFSDSTGDFTEGTYVRNPPGTAHSPWTDAGTTIFVKLRQFDDADLERVVVDSKNGNWTQGADSGVKTCLLHRYANETVETLRIRAGSTLAAIENTDGEEILILSGRLKDSLGEYRAGTWIRNPPGVSYALEALDNAVIYRKTGHLTDSIHRNLTNTG